MAVAKESSNVPGMAGRGGWDGAGRERGHAVSLERLLGPKRDIPATAWNPLGAVLLVIAVSIAAALLTGLLLIAVVFAVPEIRFAFQARCTGEARLACMMPGLGALNLLYFFIVAGLAVAARWKRGATLANTLLLRSAHWSWWQYAAFGVTTVATLVIVQQLLSLLAGQLGGDPGDSMRDLLKFREMFGPLTPSTLALLVLLAVVLAPAAEEFVFRGVLFTALQKRLGPIISAIILSGAWSLMHRGYSSQNLLALFALGLLFTWIAWRTGSLYPAIFGHATNNFVAVVVLFLYEPEATGL